MLRNHACTSSYNCRWTDAINAILHIGHAMTDLGYERLKKAVATPGTTIAEIQAAVILDMRDELNKENK